ncbi:hypothetical protein, partial [Vibrio sp. S9_S30]|uniref:hypothetical protein n=1 Tax=Vibrio sp. S9_S30 TaxID=2720226 RepID=UPI001EEE57B4
MKSHSNLACREFPTLDMVEESNSKTLNPATFENLTALKSPKHYNAQLNCQKRTNAVSAYHLKYQTQRKLKMPHVFGLFELFVRA